MILKYFHLIICTVIAAGLTCCGSPDEPPISGEPGQPSVPDTPSEPSNPGVPACSRTVLVYIVADNSLGYYDFDTSDLNEMQEAVTDGVLGEDGRLLVYYNRPRTDSGCTPLLLDITPEGRVTLKEYDTDGATDVYSTDQARMTEVISDMKRLAPASQYGLVLWSHASAWLEEVGSRSASVGDVELRSFGDDRGRRMKITTLASVLEGEGFGFIYFDCCLMASVEAVYELRHATPWIVATTTELPADGTNYTLSLPYMFAPDAPDAIGIASATFDFYDAKGSTCTMSVIDTSHLDALAAASRHIMECAPQLEKPTSEIQRFSSKGSYKPLVDMSDYYGAFGNVDPELLDVWRAALADVVVYEASTPMAIGGVKINTHCGLSTLLISDPAETDYMGYRSQSWWKDVVNHNPDYK